MFGKKTLDSHPVLQETEEAWLGPEMGEGKSNKGKEKTVVSAEDADRVRRQFYKLVNSSTAANLTEDEMIGRITQAVREIVDTEKIPLNWKEQSLIAQDLLNDMMGLGPIEVLLRDETITDILVNSPESVFIERSGILELTELQFRDELHVQNVARRIAISAGRRIDESNPMVDARLSDGSRVNIIIPPLSVHGTIISIRKFSTSSMNLQALVAKGSLTDQMAAFLEITAGARLNMLISGGTGAGKTTLLNALSAHIGEKERVVTIEDAAEIDLIRPHVISLETRQRNIEGGGEVSQRDLLRNALRMRPDRIIIGEVRGPEAYEMLQAMNTGHDGSMSTIHSNSARDALVRIEDLLLVSQQNFHPTAVRRQIASALDIVVHMARDSSGHRHIQSITEVVGVETDTIVTQDLFTYEEEKKGKTTISIGAFKSKPLRPYCEGKVAHYNLGEQLREVLNW